MINKEKKQLVEMGDFLKNDFNGKYRNGLRNRIAELRQQAEQATKTEKEGPEIARLEAFLRALLIADRILDKVLLESHAMNAESRPLI